MEIEKKDMESLEEQVNDKNGDQSVNRLVKPKLKGDKLNLVLLVFLCTLQGIPMGISLAIKTYMQNKKVPYIQQAKFGMVDLPYSLKLLWAPMVDAAYFRRIGKRKTWLVPTQLLIGFALMYAGSNLNGWLTGNESQINILTCVFFCVNLLASTQDIAIDGWGITMLRRENVGYASTCNTSGQAMGIALGYVFFILFESEEFCNKWLRFTEQKGGIVTMKGYLYFWGMVYIVATSTLAVFKREKCDQSDKGNRMNVTQTYKLLWKIMNLQTIQMFAVVMLAYEIAFSSLGSTVSNPKFMEYGVAKEDIAMIDMSLIPIRIFIPILVSKYTSGPKSLRIFYKTVPFRLILGISSAVLMYYTPYFIHSDNISRSIYFYLIYELHRISRLTLSVVMYLGVQSFFSRISDPRIGGTYMSLLNTVWYFGMATARITALGLLNPLSIKRCSTDDTNTCQTKNEFEICEKDGIGKCTTILDGYFVEVGICTTFGIIWYVVLRKVLKNLQSRPMNEWQVDNGNESTTTVSRVGYGKDDTYNLPDLVDVKNPKLVIIKSIDSVTTSP